MIFPLNTQTNGFQKFLLSSETFLLNIFAITILSFNIKPRALLIIVFHVNLTQNRQIINLPSWRFVANGRSFGVDRIPRGAANNRS